jgi:Leucine-rich repeat (LRR) protein
MNKINFIITLILTIKSPPKSVQDDKQQTLFISSNITFFDLSQVRMENSNIKIIIANNLLKTLTNSNRIKNTIVIKLDLSNNMIEYVDRNTFLNFQNLEEITLVKNRLKYFDIYFSSSLQYLKLSENQIKYVNGESLKHLKNLSRLELQFNKIELVKNDTYNSVSSMECLMLYGNLIHTIEDDSFAEMKRLQLLFLFSNKLEKIHKRMFRRLFTLKGLWLFENNMIEIETESFIDLNSLEKLHLYSNKLTVVNNLTFIGLHSLQELWLQVNNLKRIDTLLSKFVHLKSFAIDNNDLAQIDADCFLFNRNLDRIELSSNAISHISSLNIENLVNLNEMLLVSNLLTSNFYINNTRMIKLNLEFNRMIEFRKTMFLPNLEKLLVSNNRVQTLTNDVFIYLKSLQLLDFSVNRLIKIENASFRGLINLKTLSLNNNYLDDSESDYFIDDLSLLEYLDLSYNYFKYLSKSFFKRLKSLKTLRLNNNQIKEVGSSLFVDNTGLVMMNLSSNCLKMISLNLTNLTLLDLNFNQIKSFEFYLPHLKRLYLANNQIEDLNLKNMFSLEFIDLSNNLFKSLNDSVIFEVRNLRSLRMNGSYNFGVEKILNLNYLTELDLSFCSILVKNFSLKLERIRFRGVKNFNEFNTLLSSNLKELDLSRNSLKNSFSIFDSLVNLETLELSDVELNEIVQIRLENFQNLTKLDLSYNQLAYLNENTFSKMFKLIYLDLSFNRIKDANVENFKWLNSLVYLNIEHNYICSLGDVFLNYLNIKTLILANNCIEQLPQFEIKKDGNDKPIPLRIVDLKSNRLVSLGKLSGAINQIESLELDSNNISSIEHDALTYLTGLKNLSLSDNRLKNLTYNNFLSLFSLERLNLSTNLIDFIEGKTFQNLNKLLILDLSGNLLISLDMDIFYGLKNLKILNLKGVPFKLNNKSFNYVSNISSIYLDERIVEENECMLIQSLKRFVIKESFFYKDQMRQVKRSYYKSLNFLSFLSLTNKTCDMKLFYLQFNIHLNLMSDNDVETFYVECGKFIVKKENYYYINKVKCGESFSNEAKRIFNFRFGLKIYSIIILIFNIYYT